MLIGTESAVYCLAASKISRSLSFFTRMEMLAKCWLTSSSQCSVRWTAEEPALPPVVLVAPPVCKEEPLPVRRHIRCRCTYTCPLSIRGCPMIQWFVASHAAQMSSRKRYDCGEVDVPSQGLPAVFVIDWPTGDPASEMCVFVIDTMLW